jgi:hypothetical protein
MGNRLKLKDIESVAAKQIDATECLRRNLLHRMLESISTDDMGDIVAAQVTKAKGGDSRAAKLITEMLSMPTAGTDRSVNVQQTVVASGLAVDGIVEARKHIAVMIALTGPVTTEDVAMRMHIAGEHAIRALQCEWFARENGRWHITNKARDEVIDAPARSLAHEVTEGVSDER